jgi:hypothetical protein
MRNTVLALALAVAPLALAGCSKGASAAAANVPATAGIDGARALLAMFVAPGADVASLSKALHPAAADYAAVWDDGFAKTLSEMYEPVWASGQLVIAGKPGQSQVLVFAATSQELKAGSGNAEHFPGGYRKVVEHLRDGVTLYSFKFVEPGKTLGMAYDGLAYVNGHWRIFPKPFRAVRQ